MHNPFVSVIIPNYCHAKYLDQRIQSVLNQTYQNFEVIILDDASPDNGASKDVIEKYRGNPHISHIVYNEVNSGSTFKQWHKGFELAKGELIWIAESDDYSELNYLEKTVDPFIKNKDVSFVYSDLLHVDDEGKEVLSRRNNPHNIKSTKPIYDGVDFIKERMAFFNSVWNASSVVFRKDSALSVSPEYMTFRSAGDYLFWIELAERGQVVKIDQCLTYYRVHDDSVSPRNRINGTLFKEEYRVLGYVRHHGYIGPIRWTKRFLEMYKQVQTNGMYSSMVRKDIDQYCNRYHLINRFTLPLFGSILNGISFVQSSINEIKVKLS